MLRTAMGGWQCNIYAEAGNNDNLNAATSNVQYGKNNINADDNVP